MSLTRNAIISDVMDETHQSGKLIEIFFPDVLYEMSRAVTEDGEPIPLQDLKIDGTLSIVDGDYYKALPDGFVFLYARPELRYDTDKGRLLIKKDREWLDWHYPNRANNTSNKSKPAYFSLEDNRFDFAPRSDGSYTIIFPYTRMHPAVASNSDTILFKDQFKDVIKHLLKKRLYESLNDKAKQTEYEIKGLSLLRTLSVVGKRNSSIALITQNNDY